MSGLRSRQKGASWEREVAKLFREAFPESKRGLVQSRAGDEAADVEGVSGLWIECKAHRKVDIQAAMNQAIFAAKTSGRLPVVASKSDRCVPLASMRLYDFVQWMAEFDALRKARDEYEQLLAQARETINETKAGAA